MEGTGRIPMSAVLLWSVSEGLEFKSLLKRIRAMDTEYLRWEQAKQEAEEQRRRMENKVHAKR